MLPCWRGCFACSSCCCTYVGKLLCAVAVAGQLESFTPLAVRCQVATIRLFLGEIVACLEAETCLSMALLLPWVPIGACRAGVSLLMRCVKRAGKGRTKYTAVSSDEPADPEHSTDLELVAYPDDASAPEPQVSARPG